MRAISWLVASISIMLSACGGTRIGGVVRSGSGEPLADATVSIDGAQAVATTDSKGRYALDCAPGNLTLLYVKRGFTSEVVAVEVVPKKRVQAEDVVLYPLPASVVEGVQWITPDGLKDLPRTTLECRRQESESSRTDAWVVPRTLEIGKVPALSPGTAVFVTKAETDPVLVQLRKEPDGSLVAATVRYTWGAEIGTEQVRYPVSAKFAGKEQLRVLTVHLEPGLFFWRDTVPRKPSLPVATASGAIFRVDGGKT